jgi:hypothetical protein
LNIKKKNGYATCCSSLSPRLAPAITTDAQGITVYYDTFAYGHKNSRTLSAASIRLEEKT